MTFIKFTNVLNNKDVVINTDLITCCHEDPFNEQNSKIYFGLDNSICVKQSLKQVINCLNEQRFGKLEINK